MSNPGISSLLLTDLYELTMAYGFWKSGLHEREAVFHLFFRKCPFGGGYCVAAGLADVLEFLRDFRLRDDEAAYLAGLTGNDGRRLFDPAFLEHLRHRRFRWDLHAVPEGTVVFPGEPLVRVRGPFLDAQIVETALLNLVNFQTLVATKAARVCQAAGDTPVIEFGLRRAQGVNGAMAASRAAFIGGCAATSNVLAGMRHGIPVRGTLAHSWVMAFESECAAFDAYARALPNNCILLVDTYDTLQGVRHAIETARNLRSQGHELAGVRIDSGDLAALSRETRRLLDAAGFPHAVVVASNDLDEQRISALRARGASIAVWGVGTRLVTGHPDAALGGVYKLAAIRSAQGAWRYCVKRSEQAEKTTWPGIQQVRRFRVDGQFAGDMIFNEAAPPQPPWQIVDPHPSAHRRAFPDAAAFEDLLVPVVQDGRQVRPTPPLIESRARAAAQLAALPDAVRRLHNPEPYPVGPEPALHALRETLLAQTVPHTS